jgi:hypothetical protein
MHDQPFTLFRPKYTVKLDNGTREQRTSDVYNVRFRDHLNRRQTLAGYRQERRTLQLAERLQRLIECRQIGTALPADMQKWLDSLPDKTRDRLAAIDLIDAVTVSADRPLIEHLDGCTDEQGGMIDPGYKQALAARGVTDMHVTRTTTRVRAILDGCRFTFWKELVAPGATGGWRCGSGSSAMRERFPARRSTTTCASYRVSAAGSKSRTASPRSRWRT